MQCIFLVTPTQSPINHVPYQMIQYDEKGVFPAQLMDNTPIQVLSTNGEHIPSSHLVLTTNIQYYKNTQTQKVLHPSTQEVKLSQIFG